MPDLRIDCGRAAVNVEPKHPYEYLQPAPSGWFGGTEPTNP